MIISLIGPDTYRSFKNLAQLKEKYRREVDESGINIIELSGSDVTLEKVRSAVLTQSFLVKKRMLILKYPEEAPSEEQGRILEFFSGEQYPKDDVITIVFSKGSEKKNNLLEFLKKQKHTHKFDELKGRELEEWIVKEARNLRPPSFSPLEKGGDKKGGLQLDREAMNKLIAFCGSDTWRIAAELRKLAAYCGDRKAGSLDVENLVAATEEQNIFELVDAAANKQTDEALKLLAGQLEAGADPHYLFSMLARQIRIVSSVQALMTEGVQNEKEIAQRLSLHPFVVKKAKQQSASFSKESLVQAWEALVQTDRLLKRSRASSEIAFQRFILTLA